MAIARRSRIVGNHGLPVLLFFKQKTAYEIKECDWSSDVCSSDLRTSVEKQPRHFGKRDVRCFKMMLAASENFGMPEDDAMAGDEIITEHRDGAQSQPPDRFAFELNMDSSIDGQALGLFIQWPGKSPFIQQTITAQENIKFKVVVWFITSFCLQHAAFTTPIAAAQDKPFQFGRRNELPHSFLDLAANGIQPSFQFGTAVNCESLAHAECGRWVEHHSSDKIPNPSENRSGARAVATNESGLHAPARSSADFVRRRSDPGGGHSTSQTTQFVAN